MRILIPLRERDDRHLLATDLARERSEILGRGDNAHGRLGRAGVQHADGRRQQDMANECGHGLKLLKRCAQAVHLERVRGVRADREIELEQKLIGRRVLRIPGVPDWPRIRLNSLGRNVSASDPPQSMSALSRPGRNGRRGHR